MTVATTILEQLGGRKFIAMTGARKFYGVDNLLVFTLPVSSYAKGGINRVRITLNGSDLYDVEFLKIGRSLTADPVLVSEALDVSCEDLQRVFTDHTGLYTSL